MRFKWLAIIARMTIAGPNLFKGRHFDPEIIGRISAHSRLAGLPKSMNAMCSISSEYIDLRDVYATGRLFSHRPTFAIYLNPILAQFRYLICQDLKGS
jgi:hypothetical protein